MGLVIKNKTLASENSRDSIDMHNHLWKDPSIKRVFAEMFFTTIFSLPFFLLISTFPILLQASVERITLQVISKLPHELPAFTQGLAIEEDQLYESTGLYGQSSLRILNILTGKVMRRQSLDSNMFAEGIAILPNHVIQITWKERQALLYEKNTWKLQQIFFYSGEGWGLCRDGDSVWMSNGTSLLTQRDLKTFASLRTIRVQLNGDFFEHLNDLECVGNNLYANIWQKNWILRIDKITGEVTGIIDASTLLSQFEKRKLLLDHVLNGIAFRPKTNTFFLTGKEWPWIFEVRLIYE